MNQRDDYELIIVVADSELKVFLERLIARGQERQCLAPFTWRIESNAMRDAMCSKPEVVVEPFRSAHRALLVWDHLGSGREAEAASDNEARIVTTLEARGWPPDSAAAVAIEPELEGTLVPVWTRVKELLARRRDRLPPTDPEIASATSRRFPRLHWPEGFRTGTDAAMLAALAKYPKEVFQGLIDVLQLRAQPALFEELGRQLSLPGLKAHPSIQRIAHHLETWFPGRARMYLDASSTEPE